MSEVALALFSSASFAASHVVSRRGIGMTSVSAGYLIIVGCAWVVVAIPLLFDPGPLPSGRALILFAISGLFAPAVSRAAALAGVRALGPSIAVPIQQGLRPLIAVPAAAILLSETVGVTRAAGLAAIVTGGWILSRERGADALVSAEPIPIDHVALPETVATAVDRRPRTATWGFRRGIGFPVAAAVGYAAADLLVKVGLNESADPVYAAPLSIGTGLLVWSVAHAAPSVRRRFQVGQAAGWLVASGALMGLAILLLFHALARGDVSLVAPMIGTQPLFVLLLSWLILRNIERRDRSTVVAASVVVVGTVLVSL